MDPPTILVTCTDEVIGAAVLRRLEERYGEDMYIVSSTSDPTQVNSHTLYFDWADPKRSADTLRKVACAFLMHPSSMTGMPHRFLSLLSAVPVSDLPHLVYISTMEDSPLDFYSHRRVENIIRQRCSKEYGNPYTILRHSYLMQEIDTKFGSHIRHKNEIAVPSGEAPFVWIDAEDVAEAAAEILICPTLHAGILYTLTGEVRRFRDVAHLLEFSTGHRIRYSSPNPVAFFAHQLVKERSGLLRPLQQTTRHFTKQFTPTPPTTHDFETITGHAPTPLQHYLNRTFAV